MTPEFPYPTPTDDCYKATLHVLKLSDQLGIDLNKLILAGDSAGIIFKNNQSKLCVFK